MIAWIGLGSNKGDREGYLREAIETLDARPGFRLLAASAIFQTPPFGPIAQGPFLNAAAAFETDLDPEALLRALKALEVYLGRRESVRWGPREIDLDILIHGDHQLANPDLTIPHAGLRERPFALIPLADAARALGAAAGDGVGWAMDDMDKMDKMDGALEREALEIAARADAWLDEWRRSAENDPEKRQHGMIEKWEAPPLKVRRGAWRAIHLDSPAATEAFGGRLARMCRGGEVFALGGSLGAGKTCLARGFARGLGIHQPIQSPTFNLCRSYDGALLRLHHWDFYRMENPSDLDSAGFDDTLEDSGAVVVVEWAGKFPERWDFPHIRIELEAPKAPLDRACDGEEMDEDSAAADEDNAAASDMRRTARIRFPGACPEARWIEAIEAAAVCPGASAQSARRENSE